MSTLLNSIKIECNIVLLDESCRCQNCTRMINENSKAVSVKDNGMIYIFCMDCVLETILEKNNIGENLIK